MALTQNGVFFTTGGDFSATPTVGMVTHLFPYWGGIFRSREKTAQAYLVFTNFRLRWCQR